MKRIIFSLCALLAGCHYSTQDHDPLSLIQIQDRNGLTETISNKDRLIVHETTDFLEPQPYKKVLRVYKNQGKNSSIITTYHPNGTIYQYLEAHEMRANGAYREWFANGIQKIEAKVIGGTADLADGAQDDWIFDGSSKVWDEQGNLVAAIEYSKGSLEGKSLYYYPNGNLKKELFFKDNRLSKTAFEFTPDGEIKSKTEYNKGVPDGQSVGYFSKNEEAWHETFREGRLLRGTYYDLKGELLSEVIDGFGFQARYFDGALMLVEFQVGIPHGLVKEHTSSGDVVRTFFIKDGRKNGEEIEYFVPSTNPKNPQPKLSLNWKDNTIHGSVKTWYDNGQLRSEREYSLNQKIGPSLAWYKEGSLMMYEEYEDDRLLKGQYYKIHEKQPISSILNGSGIATIYDENGKLLRKVVYLNGKPVEPED